MGSAIGDLLPLALGVAISPIPIIAVILMLLAPNARGASLAFALGWLVGIVAVTVVASLLATSSSSQAGQPADGVSWVKLLAGLLLIALGIRQWRSRPPPGGEAPLPAWMAAVDKFTPLKAAGLGIVLSAVNPKNLLLCVGAGAVIGGADLIGADTIWSVIVFTAVAGSTVVLPVLSYLIAGSRFAPWLAELKVWLQTNNAAVMTVLLLVLGVVLFGKGLGPLLT
jgi:hypothetical protein